MKGREAGTEPPPALPDSPCDVGPSQHMMKRSLRPRWDLTVTMPTHFHSIMERVSVMLNHCPRLTDAETEAQWVGQAGPRLAQHISARAQPRPTCWLLALQFWAWVRSVKKRESPVTMSCGGGLMGRLGHSGLEPGLLCV